MAFWTDLRLILQEWSTKGRPDHHGPRCIWVYLDSQNHILLQQIWNHQIYSYKIWRSGSTNAKLMELSHWWTFSTWVLHNTPYGYLSGLDAIGDHQCLWVDLTETQTFGETILPLILPWAEWLKMENPYTVKNLYYLADHITIHELLAKTQIISTSSLVNINLINDTLWIQGMLVVIAKNIDLPKWLDTIDYNFNSRN